MTTALPFISIVIPARNEQKFISSTIDLLLRQDYPCDCMEIIVLDGMSDDATADIVREIARIDARVRFLENPKQLSSSARNIGARNARGEVITYIDAHVYIDNDQLLKKTAEYIREHHLDVLSRPQFLDAPGITPFQDAVALARKSRIGHGLDSTIFLTEDRFIEPYSSGASYTRKVFSAIGYFDEAFDAAEDVEFNYRCGKAGFNSFTSMNLAVYYFPRENLKDLFRQMTRYGVGRMRLFRKHRAGMASGPLLLGFLFGVYLFLASASIFFSPLRLTCLILAVLYATSCIADCLIIDLKRTVRHLFRLIPIFLCIHLGLLHGLFREFCNRRVNFNRFKSAG